MTRLWKEELKSIPNNFILEESFSSKKHSGSVESAVLVAVENTGYGFDKLFSYLTPGGAPADVLIGRRVLVGFGKSRYLRQGIVFAEADIEDKGELSGLKKIKKVIDEKPLFTPELLKLASYIADETFCTYFEAARAMVPAGLCMNTVKTWRAVSDSDEIYDKYLTEDEKKVFDFLKSRDGFSETSKIYSKLKMDSNSGALESLYEKGLVISATDTLRKIGDASEKIVHLSDEYSGDDYSKAGLTKRQIEVIDFLRKTGSASVTEISYYLGVTKSVAENLKNKNIVYYENVESFRTPKMMRNIERDTSDFTLTDEQSKAFENLKKKADSGKYSQTLLFGVTGSGKTRVYMKLIDSLSSDTGVIMLVPEISLTPQALSIFYSRYGSRVAVLHSGLSAGERTDEWKRVKNGEANFVIGTRSAVFAPVRNLKLIIIDEEQESAYKSEMTPKYSAYDAAHFRAKYNNALLLMGSATPSVTTFARCRKGLIDYLELKNRYAKGGLPEVTVVDTSIGENMGARKTLSTFLVDEIKKNLDNKEQTILLINRRGFNTFVACTSCKKVLTCPNCSISLTYHSANNRLMCHYCGYSEPMTDVCPSCGSKTVRYSGFGTQLAEAELNDIFPDANILRMDADTTAAKDAHEKKFVDFKNGKYDIMVGTQMVAKGLDFPNVTLVGVISVDQQLYNDDYMSSERTFDLLTQVIGRSGRGEKKGRAVIQTVSPENELISLASRQDYESFFDSEIKIRKAMVYPPYCDLCVIEFKSRSDSKARESSRKFFNSIKEKFSENEKIKVVMLGPVAPRASKLSGFYRQRIIIKCHNSADFRQIVSESLREFLMSYSNKDVSVSASINPESVI